MYEISDELFYKIQGLTISVCPKNKDFYSKQELMNAFKKVAKPVSDSQFRKDLLLMLDHNPPGFIHALSATSFNRVSAIYLVVFRILTAEASNSRYQGLFALNTTVERFFKEEKNEQRENSQGYTTSQYEYITVEATPIWERSH